MLDHDQQFADVIRQRFSQQQADVRVQLVDVTHGVDAQMIFWNPAAVAKAGCAVVAGAGCDF